MDIINEACATLATMYLPHGQRNTDIGIAFEDRAAWEAIAASPLTLPSDLDTILTSDQPPPVTWFKTLPKPSKTHKQWGVYACLLVHPDSQAKTKLYIGSGTNAMCRIRARYRDYLHLLGPFGMLVQKALSEGYIIDHWGLLCSIRMPNHRLVPRSRARILVIETFFTLVFRANRKNILEDCLYEDFFHWDREVIEWESACTHLPFREGIGGDLNLTDEQLDAAAAARAQASRDKTARCRKRQRDADEKAYLEKNNAEQKRKKTRNPGQILKNAADTRNRAKALQRFRCDPCSHDAASQSALNEHLDSIRHHNMISGNPKTGVTEAALRKRRNEAENRRTERFKCVPCNHIAASAQDLKRHRGRNKHKNTVAALKAGR